MSVAIHAASGKDVGLGHMKRSLSIADELRRLAYNVDFVTDTGEFIVPIEEAGIRLRNKLKETSKYCMIIIDKYNPRENVLTSYKNKCDLLVRIDDGAPTMVKDKISDVLINGNPYASPALYDGLVKKDCHLLMGSKYIPMDRKLSRFRNKFKVRENISSIVVTFGSSNSAIESYAYNITKNLLLSDLSVNILLINGQRIDHKFAHMNARGNRIKLLPYMKDIGKVFLQADLAVCSASTTCWQLAALGVPFIAFKTASNQELAFEYIKNTKIGIALGDDSIWDGDLEKNISLFNKAKRVYYSSQSRKRIDCKGSARIARRLNQLMSINRN